MDARTAVGAAAVAAIVALQLWAAAGPPGAPPARRATAAFAAGDVRHDTRPLPRLTLAQLLGDPAAAAHRAVAAPFVLTDLCAGECALRPEAVAPPALMDAAANWAARADVEFYPRNMDAHGLLRRPVVAPLAAAVAAAVGAPGANASHLDADGDPRRYAQWNTDAAQWARLLDDVAPGLPRRLPPALAFSAAWLQPGVLLGAGGSGGGAQAAADAAAAVDDWLRVTHWRMLLVGNERAGMFHHRDALPAGSWQLQLRGAKRWHLCPPEAAWAVAAPDAASPALLLAAGGGGGLSEHVGLDMLHPGDGPGQAGTYAAHPRALRAPGCFLDVVATGEALVYPPGWWHQMENVVVEAAAAVGGGRSDGDHGSSGDDHGDGDGDRGEFGAAAPHSPATAAGDVAVALTESIVTADSWRPLLVVTRRRCGAPHRPGVTPGPQLCAALPALHAAWAAHFGGGGGGGEEGAGGAAEDDEGGLAAAMDL